MGASIQTPFEPFIASKILWTSFPRGGGGGGGGNTVISASDDTIQMNRRANTLLLGLFIHGMTDGIALGSSLSNPSVSSIIFLAIIIHKGTKVYLVNTSHPSDI